MTIVPMLLVTGLCPVRLDVLSYTMAGAFVGACAMVSIDVGAYMYLCVCQPITHVETGSDDGCCCCCYGCSI